MTILQRTPNLPGKFSCDPLPQSSVTDLVQHLTSTGILENNIVVMLVYHFSHATNVGVIEKHGRGGAKSTNLLGGIFGPLEDCRDVVDSLLMPEPLIEGGGLVWTLGRILNSQL